MTVLYLYLVVWGVTDWAFSISGSYCLHTVILCHFPCFLAQLSPPATEINSLCLLSKKIQFSGIFVSMYLYVQVPQSPSPPGLSSPESCHRLGPPVLILPSTLRYCISQVIWLGNQLDPTLPSCPNLAWCGSEPSPFLVPILPSKFVPPFDVSEWHLVGHQILISPTSKSPPPSKVYIL